MFESNHKKEKRGYVNEALTKILEAIISGELRPNQRLVERQLSKRLGMSRTPLREAIRQLQLMGHVTVLPNGGVIVSEFSPKQIKDIFEIREALDTKAIELACIRATEQHISKAQEYLKLAAEAVDNFDYDNYSRYNSMFHEALREGCGNEKLIQVNTIFTDYQYLDKRMTHLLTRRELARLVKQHDTLLKAIRERNVREAKKIIKAHIDLATKVAIERLR